MNILIGFLIGYFGKDYIKPFIDKGWNYLKGLLK